VGACRNSANSDGARSDTSTNDEAEELLSGFSELVLVLVRLDHIASAVVNANHGIM